MFDIENTGALPVLLTGRFNAVSNWTSDGEYSVYYKSGTYAGFQSNLAAWALLGTDATNGAGTSAYFTIDTGSTFLIEGRQKYAFAIFHTGGSGLADGNGAIGYRFGSTTVDDGNLKIVAGSGKQYGTAADPFAGLTFTPRTGVVQVEYDVVPEPASIAALSLGALALMRRRRRR